MKTSLLLALSLSVTSFSSLPPAQASAIRAGAAKQTLVSFSIINMSGTAREVHVGGGVIPLPVAKAVVMRVRAGDCVQVVSSTNSKFLLEIVISPADEGKVLTVGFDANDAKRNVRGPAW